MYTARYVRALLKRRSLEFGSHAKLAKQLGMNYGNLINELSGKRNVSSRTLRLLNLRKMFLYVPKDMTAEELDTRLAIGRRGTSNGKAKRVSAA